MLWMFVSLWSMILKTACLKQNKTYLPLLFSYFSSLQQSLLGSIPIKYGILK